MHSIHLSQSLKTFQNLHGEITPMLKEHTLSLSNSVRYIEQLRTLTKEANQTVTLRAPEIQVMKQDLEFLTNRANQVADHLEKLLQETRVMGLTTRPVTSTQTSETSTAPTTAGLSLETTLEKPTTKTTIAKRLRQKISATPSKPNFKSTATKTGSKKVEAYNFSSLSKKLADKVREKTNAA